jgi:hypothetical protein
MDVIRKDATITNTDDEGPGSFEVVLSTPAKDRDGDELAAEDWKLPLPEHITFDTDHGMSVASTVGSGVPSIEDGKLVVRGTYSSLPRAQEVRTLVKEGHIRTTSVAFMSEKLAKDASGKSRTVRELLNGAFVAIPSNREALVLSSKALEAKAGARHSAADMAHIQAIHDAALALGAMPADSSDAAEGATGGKEAAQVETKTLGVKAVAGSYEQRQQAVSDALDALYHADDNDGDNDRYVYAYPLATFNDSVVYRVSGSSDENGQWQATYTYNDDGTVTLGTPERVNMVETVVPVDGSVPKGYYLIDLANSDDPTEETAPVAAEKAAPAAETDDGIALQNRLTVIKTQAALAG